MTTKTIIATAATDALLESPPVEEDEVDMVILLFEIFDPEPVLQLGKTF